MKRHVLIGLVLLLAASVADARPFRRVVDRRVSPATAKPDLQREIGGLERTLEERVIQLPEDGGKCHLSIFVRKDGTPADNMLLKAFSAEPGLADLRRRCHWHVYTPSDPHWKAELSKTTCRENEFPCVMIQKPSGEVVYKASGDALPATARALAGEMSMVTSGQIAASLESSCFRCPRPKPQPTPAPEPEPVLEPVPDVKPQPVGTPLDWVILLAVIVLAAAGFFAFGKHTA